jgi:hypothetical protein
MRPGERVWLDGGYGSFHYPPPPNSSGASPAAVEVSPLAATHVHSTPSSPGGGAVISEEVVLLGGGIGTPVVLTFRLYDGCFFFSLRKLLLPHFLVVLHGSFCFGHRQESPH